MDEVTGTILIVDDVPANIQVLHAALDARHQVYFATSGRQAIDLCLAKNPDIVLLDIDMPEMNGFEVCRFLKQDERTSDIVIIFVTAMDQERDEIEGLRLGAGDFITKPVRPAVVRLRVDNQLRLKRLQEHLADLGTRDGLTGIANRRLFDKTLGREWRRSLRLAAPLSLVLLDVDHFKFYNDYYGHPQGDACLQQVAHTLDELARRPLDLAARYGGEEFAIILPDTDQEGAVRVAETLRRTVSDLALPHARSPVAPHVTISLGCATTTARPEQTAESLLHGADQALYAAKRNGRNQVASAPTE